MKRGSVVAPIILILIGGIFLLNNIRPEFSVLDTLASYWPFILIAWGLLRLAEILIAASNQPQPQPGAPPRNFQATHGLSGGEWLLIVFLCLVGSGAFFVKRHAGNWAPNSIRSKIIGDFGDAFDYPIEEKKVATGKTPKVLIENFRGNARVVGTDADEVRVSGRKTVRALQQSDADDANQRSPIELTNQNDMVVIRTNQDRAPGDRTLNSDLEISVPRGATVEGHGRYGDFDINDLSGSVEIISDNAGVRVQNIGGSVRMDLRKSDLIRVVNVKGPVEVKGRGQNVEMENVEGQVTITGSHSGDLQFRNLAKPLRFDEDRTNLRVEKTPGQIRMARGYFRGSNLVGPVQLTARSKDIEISDFTQGLDLSIERGDIDLRPMRVPLSKMDVRTGNGEVSLALPLAAKFDLRATVQKGEVQNDFGDPIRAETSGRGASLRGGVGDGPVIILNADHGSVIVRKGDASLPPLPPMPPMSPPPPPGKLPKIVVERN
ncbi:MAG: DUF4097 family beta strand repeat-containing protein [Bryobacteraceae bacterium]